MSPHPSGRDAYDGSNHTYTCIFWGRGIPSKTCGRGNLGNLDRGSRERQKCAL